MGLKSYSREIKTLMALEDRITDLPYVHHAERLPEAFWEEVQECGRIACQIRLWLTMNSRMTRPLKRLLKAREQ